MAAVQVAVPAANACDDREEAELGPGVTTPHGKHEPRLVRGFTGHDCKDPAAVTAIISAALGDEDPLWKAATSDQVTMANTSGFGPATTFKVTLPNAHPESVALHSRVEDLDHFGRMGHAQDMFAERQIGPQRLAYGTDWMIDAWQVSPLRPGGFKAADWKPGAAEGIENWARAGRMLAEVHKVPTDWFEVYRKELVAKFPLMKDCSKGADLWVYLTRVGMGMTKNWGYYPDLQVLEDPELFKKYVDGPFATKNCIAGKVVTVHGDFHPGNFAEGADGRLQLFDYEFACVAQASHDLKMGILDEIGTVIDLDQQRAFVGAYLEALGEPLEELEDLLVEIHLAGARMRHSAAKLCWWEVQKEKARPEVLERRIERCDQFCEEVRKSADLREKVCRIGFDKLYAGVKEELDALAMREVIKNLP